MRATVYEGELIHATAIKKAVFNARHSTRVTREYFSFHAN